MVMRLEVVYYRNGVWFTGYMEGDDMGWRTLVFSRTKPETLKLKAASFIPVKRYVENFIATSMFLNKKGVDDFIENMRYKLQLPRPYIWIDYSLSQIERRGIM